MKMKFKMLKLKVQDKVRPIYTRIRRFFICEVELDGQVFRGLEYRNIGSASLAAGVLGIFTFALCSGVTLRGMAQWMGFLPQDAQGAVMYPDGTPADRPREEKPREGGKSRTVPTRFELQIVESNTVSPSSTLSRGAFLLGVLMNRIVSEQENTPVLVRLPQGAQSHGKMIVPPDSLIIGSTQGKSERRIFVSFHTLRTPVGDARPIRAQLLSPDGSAGLAGEFSSGRGQAVAGAAISAFVSGAASGLMTFQAGPLGAVADGSFRNSMLSGLAGTANFAADTYTQDMRNARGVTEAEAHTLVLVMLDDDFSMEERK